jgi:flavin reductase (DIM6/NTAB) family NADH-FMN oxidoreductase RutF/rubredoxin
MIDYSSLFKISYGLYIVASGDRTYGNGFISNTVFQITADPPRFAISCSRDNYTNKLIKKYKTFSVSILGVDTPTEIIGKFGYSSGKDINKFKNMDIKYSENGTPIVMDSAIATLEFKVGEIVEVGTHTIFISNLLTATTINDKVDPLTYKYYRDVKNGLSPKNAPTYIDKSKLDTKVSDSKKYQCTVCGYIHDDSKEDTPFNQLDEDWRCPVCRVEKSMFEEVV